MRFLTGLNVSLAEGQRTSVVTLTRTGQFYDPRYGRFSITREMLLSMVQNFERGAYGQDIFLDVAHKPENGAAAKILQLTVDGSRLRARVEWTPYGIESVRDKGYRYLSAEFHENFVDNEHGNEHGPTLLAAGLTIRPVIKGLDPVQLSEDYTEGVPTYLHPTLIKQLSEEAGTMKWYEKLRAQLKALKLSEKAVNEIVDSAKAVGKQLGEDLSTEQENKLLSEFEGVGKQLAEAIDSGKSGELKLSLDVKGLDDQGGSKGGQGGAKTLSEEDIAGLVTKQLADARREEDDKKRQLAEDLKGNQAIFDDVLSGAKALSESTREMLGESRELVTAEMGADQVRKFAEKQVGIGEKIEADRKLSQMGMGPVGSVQVNHTPNDDVKALQETIDGSLRGTNAHNIGGLQLPTETNGFVGKVLAEFDRLHADRLSREHRLLSGDNVNISDMEVPAGLQRTVIREALHDMTILQLVATMVDPTAQQTMSIPYEERDTSNVMNGGVVYEGQGIPAAGVAQKLDTAFMRAFKVAMRLSNEVMHFSKASPINWEAWGRNAASNARLLRELVVRDIANEMQRAADGFGALEVTGENIAARLDGSNSVIKTAEWPVVRPHQVRDLQGSAVGSVSHPIALTIDGTPVTPWDGSGNQASGTYWVLTNANLGFITLVDETGAAVTPNASTATVGYWRASNIAKFDMDVPSGTTKERHLNGLLQAFGRRKAVMSQERYVQPDFTLMSHTLNDEITNAENFVAHSKRDGTDTNAQGDLEMVKSVAAFGTNAPNIDMGEERILLGARGTTTYGIAKPYTLGQPFEAVNAQGQPTGQKVAYGEEYNAVHTPSPVRDRYTSVIAYSATARDNA